MEKTQTKEFVQKDMMLGEIVSRFPESIEPLSIAGIHCAGCGTHFDATLQEAAKEKGIESGQLEKLLDKVNATITQTQADFGLKDGESKTVALSSRAADKIRDLMQKQEKVSGLRFAAMPGGCSGYSYVLAFEEKPTQNDEVLEEKGIRVFVDKYMLPLLQGSRVDFVDSLQGSGFKITNPNAKSSCGCGQSFS